MAVEHWNTQHAQKESLILIQKWHQTQVPQRAEYDTKQAYQE